MMGKFYEITLTNKHLYIETLFWKGSPSEVYELVEGYGSFPTSE